MDDSNLPNEVDRHYLKEAIELAKKEWDPPSKNSKTSLISSACNQDYKVGEMDQNQISGYQTSSQRILSNLRISISSGNWSEAATLTSFLLEMNGRLLPVIWRTCVLVLLHHPESNPDLLDNFLERCLGLRMKAEKTNFLRKMLTMGGDDVNEEQKSFFSH